MRNCYLFFGCTRFGWIAIGSRLASSNIAGSISGTDEGTNGRATEPITTEEEEAIGEQEKGETDGLFCTSWNGNIYIQGQQQQKSYYGYERTYK